ncbi:ATP-binding protein [Frondihabitans sp. VKM Ac-2883]|uniref:ATP-binding protein n=1 Tax=Frondihabitans sp. VKM Ac-2883 TaxID=2783823 RepID=UPI00188BE02D|nr:ATP-binding protein [Frondihabitans sp. VKM Ac-2883]MBF4574707.1 AAA family ATPase [Frondihabitans sp. VKM Ac-2883]
MSYITSLHAEHFKRITAVDIDFDASGGVTTISGANGAGKTSVIDALAVAIAGKNAPKIPNPISKGQDAAVVIATTDDGLVITRKFRRKDDDTIDSTLTVTNAEGFVRKSPQALLDTLLTSYALDPQAFAAADAKKQVATLLDLVELPFDLAEVDAQATDIFETRTHVNREAKQLSAQVDAAGPIDASAPAEEVSAAELFAQLRAAQEANQQADAIVRNYHAASEEAREAASALEQAKARKEKADSDLAMIEKAGPPARSDTDALEKSIAGVDTTNAAVRANARRNELARTYAAAMERAASLTAELSAIKDKRDAGLAAATIPGGFGFGPDGLLLNGVPYSQASGAESVIAAAEVAAAGNPELRLILIRDASLLDSTSRQKLATWAEDKGLRVVMEVVDENAETGVIITDGAVA